MALLTTQVLADKIQLRANVINYLKQFQYALTTVVIKHHKVEYFISNSLVCDGYNKRPV